MRLRWIGCRHHWGASMPAHSRRATSSGASWSDNPLCSAYCFRVEVPGELRLSGVGKNKPAVSHCPRLPRRWSYRLEAKAKVITRIRLAPVDYAARSIGSVRHWTKTRRATLPAGFASHIAVRARRRGSDRRARSGETRRSERQPAFVFYELRWTPKRRVVVWCVPLGAARFANASLRSDHTQVAQDLLALVRLNSAEK